MVIDDELVKQWEARFPAFRGELLAWLERCAPCKKCRGEGFLDSGDVACPDCVGVAWKNKLED